MVKVAVAQYAWTGSGGSGDSRYLTFSAGARIEVVEVRETGGWWAGKLDGKLGWFPSSFCTIEEVAQPSARPAAAPAQPAPAPVPAPAPGAVLSHPLASAAASDPLQANSPFERQPSQALPLTASVPAPAPAPALNLLDDPLGALGGGLMGSAAHPATQTARMPAPAIVPSKPAAPAKSSSIAALPPQLAQTAPAPAPAAASACTSLFGSLGSSTNSSLAAQGAGGLFPQANPAVPPAPPPATRATPAPPVASRPAQAAGPKPAASATASLFGPASSAPPPLQAGGSDLYGVPLSLASPHTLAGQPVSGTSAYDQQLQRFNKGETLGVAAMAAANISGRKIWQHLGFIDIFADASGGARVALQQDQQEGVPPGLGELRSSLEFASRVLGALNKEGDIGHGAMQCAAESFGLGLELLSHIKLAQEHAGLLAFLEQLVPMIASLPVRKALAVPLAWASGSRALLLQLHRTDDANFSVTICNWAEGLDRHPLA